MKKLLIFFVLVLISTPFLYWYLNSELEKIASTQVPVIVVVKTQPKVAVVTQARPIPEVLSATSSSSTKKVVAKVVPKKTVSKAKTTAKPTPKPTPKPAVVTKVSSSTLLEQLVIVETNKERTQRGLKPLSTDTKLAVIARKHSVDMQSKDYFEHESPSGCDPECRIDNAGYEWQSYGENIQWMSGYHLSVQLMAEMIVDGWMNSPGHRVNILNPEFTHVGVGVSAEGDEYYTTSDYSLPG